MSPEVVDFCYSYGWPGNIRELENLIERLTILTLRYGSLARPAGEHARQRSNGSRQGRCIERRAALGDAVDEFERELIVKALQRTGFNQTKAAMLLGTSRRILKYRIEKLKITETGQLQEEQKLSN